MPLRCNDLRELHVLSVYLSWNRACSCLGLLYGTESVYHQASEYIYPRRVKMNTNGTVEFVEGKATRRYRFNVTVAEEKLHIWLEDHKTKDQWVSRDLTIGEFTTEKSVIPNATIVDYAERFVECLGATPDDAKNAFERVLATPAKDKSRQLTLSFIFAWSTFVTSLVYTFKLNMIPLERVDVLAAQIRDFQDELRVLSAVVKDVRTRQNELGFVELESVGSVARNNPLKWKVVTGDMDGHFGLDSKNLSVSVKHAGLYSLQVQVLYASSYAGAQFNLQVNGISVRQCHECIQYNDYNRRANTAYASAQRSSSMSVTRQLKSGDAVTAVFEGDGQAMEGSLLTITRLR